jgi:hypothetical protein
MYPQGFKRSSRTTSLVAAFGGSMASKYYRVGVASRTEDFWLPTS